MSGSNIDDDTLISQDDIDKLLNSSSLDEAESAISDSDDELGELSQNDIDSLLNNVSLDVDPFENKPSSGPVAEPKEDDMELVSQDDIDRLMNSMLPDDKPPARPDEPKAAESEEDDMELVSQDDIDRLMNSMLSDDKPSARPDEPKVDEPKAAEPEEDDMELVSQDDIDRLMNSMLPDDKPSVRPDEPKSDEPEEDDMELVSQDDIDRLMNSVLPDDKPSDSMNEPEKKIIETEDEILIDESQSVDIDKSLITQELIDRLLAEPIPEPISEPISESIPEPDMDQFMSPDPVLPKAISKEPDMPEEKINELLQGLGDVDDLDGNDLISQDDIDELLKGSEEEDEDIIGDWDADMDFSMDSEESDPEEHQVVLEEAEETGDSDEDESFGAFLGKPVPSGKWYRSKKVLAVCSAALVLVVALSLGLLKFFTEKEATVVSPLQVAEVLSPPEPQVEVVAIDLVEKEKAAGPGTLVLENFVLLAPGKAIGISYITASVSIDYLDGRAVAEINRHLPLYRDIIFDAMGNALGSITVDKITEADLLGNIKEALNRVLPGKYVERVTFAAFATG